MLVFLGKAFHCGLKYLSKLLDCAALLLPLPALAFPGGFAVAALGAGRWLLHSASSSSCSSAGSSWKVWLSTAGGSTTPVCPPRGFSSEVAVGAWASLPERGTRRAAGLPPGINSF